MDVSIIIVNWNSVRFLEACLASVRRYTTGIEYEIVVIDSGSFDGCGEMLREKFPDVVFLQSGTNVGFAAANNLAYRQSRGRHVLFLNPDTELTSPAVNMMLRQLERCPQAGAVGCKLYNGDGSIQTSCIQSFPTILNQTLSSEFLRRRFPASSLWGMSSLFRCEAEPAQVEAISGACLMARRSALEQVGCFSEDYFMYADDLDLCHKLQQAGYRNYYLPQATVRHFGGGCTDSAPSEFSVVMMRESIWRFLRKTRGAPYGLAYRVSTLLAAVARIGMMLALWPLRRVWSPAPAPQQSIRKWAAILAWSLRLRRASTPV